MPTRHLVLLSVAMLLPPAVASAQQSGPITYYQVSYEDGDLKDLSSPPTTNEGIRDVVQISRYPADTKGYEVLSTGRTPVTVVQAGRTVRTQLLWDGKAWSPPAPPAVAADRVSLDGNAAVRLEIARVQTVAAKLDERVRDLDHAIASGERAKDPNAAALASLKKQRDAALAASEQYRTQLEALGGLLSAGAAERPGGTVEPWQPDAFDARSDLGSSKPVADTTVPPYRTQVWKLPAASGSRTYEVALAHAQAGAAGAFRYVAYADSDGDGLPDKLIALSPPAQASKAGQWTVWRLTVDQPAVFVGQTWYDASSAVYCQPPGVEVPADTWRGLPAEIYVCPFYGGLPQRKMPAPGLPNLRIRRR